MASAPNKKDIMNKISEVLVDEAADDLPAVLIYLSEEKNTPMWETLEVLLDSPDVFKLMVKTIAEKTKQPVESNEIGPQKAVDANLELLVLDELSEADHKRNFFLGLPMNLSHFMREYQLLIALVPAALTHNIIEALTNTNAKPTADAVTIVEYGGTVLTSVVAGVRVITFVVRNVRRWYRSEIVAERCLKNIFDCLGEVSCGYGGMVAGAAVCGSGGPLGVLVGGLLGAILFGAIGGWAVKKITRTVFDLPQSEPVENAYRDLKVSRGASNAAVNKAFEDIVKKSADKAEIFKAQQAMKVIKMERQG